MILRNSYWPSQQRISKAKLVFLHGMGGTGALWRPIAAGLETDFSILAPDQRGHGGSQIETFDPRDPPRYTPLEYGKDVLETMDSLNFHPAVVIGHSMGVRTACAVAHLKPDWVQGLVLIDLGFSGPAGGGLGEGLASFLAALPLGFPSRQAAREFMDQHCPDPSIAQYLMAVSRTTPQGLVFPFDKSALIQTIHAARDSSVRTWVVDLAKKGMPILVLRGAESGVWSHQEYEKERAALSSCPSVQFVEMTGAGHGLPFEKRAEFIALLLQFLGPITS